MIEFIVINQLAFGIRLGFYQSFNRISNRMRIILLAKRIDVDAKLIITELLPDVFREAGTNAYNPVFMRNAKRSLFGCYNGSEVFHALDLFPLLRLSFSVQK